MNLAGFPRRIYTQTNTPIERLDRFSKALGGPTVYIKRDDTLNLAAGGNKTRKLEFLLADAIAKGADTILTAGAPQSNHCRLTLAASVKEGLNCQLLLTESQPGHYQPEASGNNLLYHLLGVEKIYLAPDDVDVNAELARISDELRESGRIPYPIPIGGSNPIGSLGYMACAQEILSQMFAMGLGFSAMFTPTGSGGTYGGLVAGLTASDAGFPAIGVSVSADKQTMTDRVLDMARKTARLAGIAREIPDDAVEVLDEYVGPGYAKVTDSMLEAVTLLARTEGILLDPVYTGKAMAGLIDQVRKGRFGPSDNILFLHTGGSPALYAYKDVFWNV